MVKKSKGKERVLFFKIPEEVYIALKERSKAEGYRLVTDYIKAIIMKELGLVASTSRIDELEEKLSMLEKKIVDQSKIEQRVLRKLTDLINPFTAKINELALKYSEIVEKIDVLEEKMKTIEEKIEKTIVRHEARRKTGLERLKEQGILFESDLQRLRDKDSFFHYLERGGAKIIEVVGERIAVDKDFWERFKKKLFEEITTSSEEHIKMYMSKLEYKLFEKLRESGLIYFDSTEKKWKPATKELLR